MGSYCGIHSGDDVLWMVRRKEAGTMKEFLAGLLALFIVVIFMIGLDAVIREAIAQALKGVKVLKAIEANRKAREKMNRREL